MMGGFHHCMVVGAIALACLNHVEVYCSLYICFVVHGFVVALCCDVLMLVI